MQKYNRYNPSGKDPSEMTEEERQDYRKGQMRKGRDDVLFPKGNPSVADRIVINNQIRDTNERKEDYRDAFEEYLHGGMEDYTARQERIEDLEKARHEAGLNAWKENAGKPFAERMRAVGEAGKTYNDQIGEVNEYYADRADERAYDFGHDIGEADKESFQGVENKRAEYFKNMYGDDFYEDDSQNVESGKGMEKGESRFRPGPGHRQNLFKQHQDPRKDDRMMQDKNRSSFQDAVRHGENNIQRDVDSKGLHGSQFTGPGTDIER